MTECPTNHEYDSIRLNNVLANAIKDRESARIARIEEPAGNRLELFQHKALLSPPEDIPRSY
jgi:hypothetical protein